MSAELLSLSVTAVTVGFVHCVSGPDHYVPFVAMSRVGLWSLRKTLLVTLVCGIGHVAGSAALAMIGVALGLIVYQLETDANPLVQFESLRGSLASWLLVLFGLGYFLWGAIYAWRRRAKESQVAQDPQVAQEAKPASDAMPTRSVSEGMAPWILFTIFLFGPCEPLIPMLMVPAAQANLWSAAWITTLFGLTTLVTMITLVALIRLGVFAVHFRALETYGHALAGLIVMACGLAIIFLGV
jgi:sulfite exporter TauE/SafE